VVLLVLLGLLDDLDFKVRPRRAASVETTRSVVSAKVVSFIFSVSAEIIS